MISKTEQKVLEILAANPGKWVPNTTKAIPGARVSTLRNLEKKGLIVRSRDGFKLAIDAEIDALVWEPHPEDADASKADAGICRKFRA